MSLVMSEADRKLKKTFELLKSNHADVVHILGRILDSDESIFTREYLASDYSSARISMALHALKAIEKAGLFEYSNNTYTLKSEKAFLTEVKNVLKGYSWSKKEENDGSFNLVMTTPKEPSILKRRLNNLGANKSLIRWTHEAFEDLARKAKSELIVMSPFLDKSGADLLLRLMKAANPRVKKTVILRFLDTRNKDIFDEIKDELKNHCVKMVDYSLEREASAMLETFHAKVILADNNYCYLGSSNLDRFSIENSMELGALIRGDSVKLLKNLLNIVISISKPKL